MPVDVKAAVVGDMDKAPVGGLSPREGGVLSRDEILK
ncbi:hypothetical protein KIPB_015537, partial [Kipferlia bialata]|eukprot:g15537.t1